MSKSQKQSARRPATKLPNLQKKLQKQKSGQKSEQRIGTSNRKKSGR